MIWTTFFGAWTAVSVTVSFIALRWALGTTDDDRGFNVTIVSIAFAVVTIGFSAGIAASAYSDVHGGHAELIECDDPGDNTSGNVCRVKVGRQWCIAVLPDGGKSPRYRPSYTTCPEANR